MNPLNKISDKNSNFDEISLFFSSTSWGVTTKTIFENLDATPASLIDALSQNAFLKECFSKKAGVTEGYTVGGHTEKVLEIAQRYRDSLIEKVTKIVSWSEFLLFLALHDIGKGVAHENETSLFSTSLSFKESELRNTQKILSTAMQELGVPAQNIELFFEMLSYDSQGLYLKGQIDSDEIFDNILEMARNSHTDPISFYQLFQIYHLVDAASYPTLSSLFEFEKGTIKHNKTYQEKIDAFEKRLKEINKGKEVFEDLLEWIQKKRIRKKFKNCF